MDDLIIAVILLVVFLVIKFKDIPLLFVLVLLVIIKETSPTRYADLPEGVETHKFLEIYVRQKVPP